MKKINGFTLIELLIVIAIIAVLTVLGFTNYITSQKRGRDARRMQDLEQVKAALEMYRVDNPTYPNPAAANAAAKFDAMNTVLNPNYIKTTFKDPSRGTYSYQYESDGLTYKLCAFLEKTTPLPSTCGIAGLSTYYGFSNP